MSGERCPTCNNRGWWADSTRRIFTCQDPRHPASVWRNTYVVNKASKDYDEYGRAKKQHQIRKPHYG